MISQNIFGHKQGDKELKVARIKKAEKTDGKGARKKIDFAMYAYARK